MFVIERAHYLIQSNPYYYYLSSNESTTTNLTLFFKLSQSSPVIFTILYLLYRIIKATIPVNQSNEPPTSKLWGWTEYFQEFISDSDIVEQELLKVGTEASVQAEERVNFLLPRKIPLLVSIAFEMSYWTILSVLDVLEREGSNCSKIELSFEMMSSCYLSILLASSWVIAFIFELLEPCQIPTSSIFLLFIGQMVSASVALFDSLHTLTLSPFITIQSLFVALKRLPDFLCCIFVIIYLLNLPLRPFLIPNLPCSDPKNLRPLSPEDSNTLLGSLTYSWMGPIMSLARSRPLKSLDVWSLSLNNRSEILSRRFSSLTEKTLLGKILRASSRDILIDFCLKLVAVSLNYSRPFFIQKILENLTLASTTLSSSPTDSPTYSPLALAQIFAIFAFLAMLGRSLAELIHFHHARRIGMRLRIELTVSVFEKALKRRDATGRSSGKGVDVDESASVGKVVSLISDDTNRVLRMGCDSHLIYGTPLEIILALWLLYSLMSWSALIGFSILSLAVPINYSLGKRSIVISKERSAARDARQASLQELISAIRTIKCFGWSKKFIDKTEAKRAIELQWMIQDWKNRFYLNTLWVVVSLVVPLFSFYSFVKLQENELTVAIAFTALSLFSMVRGPLNQIPDFIIRLLQTRVSVQRIESFSKEDEVASWAVHETRSNNSTEKGLGFQDAVFTWPGSSSWKLNLQSISFPEGKLSIIKGPTGSGKSSLLLALLGEMEVISGSVDLPITVSYCSQHPWLESSSIRDNIIFGFSFISTRYQSTLEACALLPDLALFSQGDQTRVGERGVALSGGQKARISLARSLYAPTQHVLLDDVLASVDSHTAKFLFENVLKGPLLQGRTCVLVTHHEGLVRDGVAYQVELKGGEVIFKGIVSNKSETSSISSIDLPLDDDDDEIKEVEVEIVELQESDIETWNMGGVKKGIYTTYLNASSYTLWSIILLLIIVRPLFSFAEQYWLSKWASESHGSVDTSYYLVGYASIGLLSAISLLLSTVVVLFASLRASTSIFSELLNRVVHAPSRFFDVTPGGRITNRFVNDVSILDESLSNNFSTFAANIAGTLASLIVTTLILPLTFIPVILFAIIYFIIFVRYLSVNRDLNRIASTTASPIFSGLQELLIGITTIRAFRKEKSYRAELCENIDETLALWYCSCTLDVWLSIRTQLLSSLCLLATASFAIFAEISPGLAGIAITSSLLVIQSLDSLCTSYGRIVTSLNSMERITEYLELPQEPSDGIIPSAIWPSTSSKQEHLIEVKDLVVRYAPDLPDVLQGISFSIKPRERIAIVGRTGSGKSTLAMSFLRFVDPISGSITIDSHSLTSLNLEVLRQRISFLPQEATLFEGTVRDNLDPFQRKNDEELEEVLKRVGLGKQEGLLEKRVGGGGGGFSSGEKQLLALARCLLRDSKIIIMDESSSNIDFNLDEMIQETIRTEFQDACLITIAHRLRTIIDYDRILVLDAGKLIEFDTPGVLLSREDGAFHKMVKDSGDYFELMKKVQEQ